MDEQQQQEREPRMYSNVTDKLGFGKYRDYTLEQLYGYDTNYLRWAVQNEIIDKDCFMTLFNETDDTLSRKKIYLDSVVWFGRYKGKTFAEVCAEDRDYAEWVLGDKGFLEYAEGNDPSNSGGAPPVNNTPTPPIPPVG